MDRATAKSQILDAANRLLQPGCVIELRSDKAKKHGVISGYFDNAEALAAAAMAWDGKVAAIYVTLNPPNDELLARCVNRVEPWANTLTKDHEIKRRAWFFIDIDACRAAGISSNEVEHDAAHALAQDIRLHLAGDLWPDPIYADSGNGAHLLYRIDMPNDAASKAVITGCLEALSARFGRPESQPGSNRTVDGAPAIKIDGAVSNAARLTKLYGTMACKGDSVPDRPHRRSRIIDAPEKPGIVTAEQMQLLCGEIKAKAPEVKGRPTLSIVRDEADVEGYLSRHGLTVLRSSPWNSGRQWILDACPFAEHGAPGKAHVEQHGSGAISAGCVSGTCGQWDWRTLTERLGPLNERNQQQRQQTAAANTVQPKTRQDTAIERAPDGMPQSVRDMLRTYTLIVGTTDAWDKRRWKQVPLRTVEAAHAARYSEWKKHEELNRIDAENIVFEPSGCMDGQMNLFRGFPSAPNKKAPHSKMVDHLAWLCSGDADLIHWVTSWLAYPLQNPGAKLATALAVHGPQGSGKNILFDAVARIYGQYALTISQSQIESQYNGWASGRLFVVADEILTRREIRTVKNRIKGLITGETIVIEDKFVSARSETNHLNIVFLSNEDQMVDIEKDDRRFCVVKTPSPRERSYYSELAAERFSGGDAGLMAHLIAHDLQGWHPHTAPIETDAKADMMRLSRDSSETFLSVWADDGIPELTFAPCVMADLHQAYKAWAEMSGERWGLDSLTRFSTRVNKLWPPSTRKIIEGHNISVCVPHGEDYNPERVFSFRAAMEAYRLKAQKAKL